MDISLLDPLVWLTGFGVREVFFVQEKTLNCPQTFVDPGGLTARLTPPAGCGSLKRASEVNGTTNVNALFQIMTAILQIFILEDLR